MFKQTEEKYKSIKLGFGSGSIYAYGCYLVSLVNGLNLNGYSFTPTSLNDYFKTKGLWVGESKNYIDVDSLSEKLPDIFASFLRAEPFEDKKLAEYINKGLTVVAKVNARAIGGNGTHFVLVTEYDGKVAKIFDPWFGDEQLVTKRYAKYGNLLGLRVFNVKKYKETPDNNIMEELEKLQVLYNEVRIRIAELEKKNEQLKSKQILLEKENDELVKKIGEVEVSRNKEVLILEKERDDAKADVLLHQQANSKLNQENDALSDLNEELIEQTKLLNAIKNAVVNLFRR